METIEASSPEELVEKLKEIMGQHSKGSDGEELESIWKDLSPRAKAEIFEKKFARIKASDDLRKSAISKAAQALLALLAAGPTYFQELVDAQNEHDVEVLREAEANGIDIADYWAKFIAKKGAKGDPKEIMDAALGKWNQTKATVAILARFTPQIIDALKEAGVPVTIEEVAEAEDKLKALGQTDEAVE